MAGYTKLFSSIVHSTLWREPHHIRIVWITMLALSDAQGDVFASIPGLADVSRVKIEECREALERFQSPDPDSGNPAHEGRRIERIQGGWRLLNHGHYRELMSAEERRARDAERKRAARAASAERPRTSANVRDVSHTDPDPTPDPDQKDLPVDQVDQNRSGPGGWEGGAGVKSAARAQRCAAAQPKPKGRPRSAKRLLPDDFAPNAEHATIARERGLSLADEVAKMRDWAAANAVQKADWGATLRNWLRRAEARHGAARGPSGGRVPNSGALDYAFRRATEED